jgi:mannitol-1-phosphate/altronate dehydrogenase
LTNHYPPVPKKTPGFSKSSSSVSTSFMSDADRTTRDAISVEHVHFGAGSFGLGMVVDICHSLAGLRTVVINRASTKEHHKVLKARRAYAVLFDGDENRRKVLKPEIYYYDRHDEDGLANVLSGPSISLITTSVRKDNLAEIGGVLARALINRSRMGADVARLCVMACENLPNNSAELQRHVEACLPREERQHLLSGVFFCNTLVDRVCAPISCRTGSVEIAVESFHNWIVQSPGASLPVLELLAEKGLLEVAGTEAEFRVHETQKYWCMNGVHLATAAYAYNNTPYLRHFSEVLAKRKQ